MMLREVASNWASIKSSEKGVTNGNSTGRAGLTLRRVGSIFCDWDWCKRGLKWKTQRVKNKHHQSKLMNRNKYRSEIGIK